jgi:hypothetical protein
MTHWSGSVEIVDPGASGDAEPEGELFTPPTRSNEDPCMAVAQ